jgi:hypothetical protein
MFKNCSRENSLCDACLESFSSLLILLFVDLLTHFSKKFVLPWREIISIHGGRGRLVALYMHIVSRLWQPAVWWLAGEDVCKRLLSGRKSRSAALSQSS